MILAHALVGTFPVSNSEFSWLWFIGSIIPDIDHLFVLIKHRLFSWSKFTDAIRFEDKYGLHFKTKYFHSIFGAAITTIPILFISKAGAILYFTAYIIHLLLDWPDTDEKQYFYPFKMTVRGFLPIFSKTEIVATFIFILVLISSYI